MKWMKNTFSPKSPMNSKYRKVLGESFVSSISSGSGGGSGHSSASSATRARSYVAAMPHAVAGRGGHDATFSVAVALVWGFALPADEAWPIMQEFNARCLPPWADRELRHKLADASRLTRHHKPQGHLCSAGGVGPSFRRKPVSVTPPKFLGRITLDIEYPVRTSDEHSAENVSSNHPYE